MTNYEIRKANYALQEYLLDYGPQEARKYSEEYSDISDPYDGINPREISTENLEPHAYRNLRILEDFFYCYTNKLSFNLTLEPMDVLAVIEANSIKWKPTDAQCIDILERAYRKTDEVGLSESSILQSIETAIVWAIEEQLDFDDFCKEELNEEPRTDFSDGSDDEESDSAILRAEMRLRAQDESDTRDLY